MEFKNENGAIVGPNGSLITIVEGSRYEVVFPQELIHELHKKSPGSVYLLAHTHPPLMNGLSHEDITTLKAQALWTYPFPARISTITIMEKPSVAEDLLETIYVGFWETKEKWKERCSKENKTVLREFLWLKEEERIVYHDAPGYTGILARMSYDRE